MIGISMRIVSLLVAAVLALGPEIALAVDTGLLWEKGRLELKSGKTAEAVETFSQLIANDPQAVYYFSRGMAYVAQGKLDAGIKDYGKAISIDPSKPVYFLQRGAAHFEDGQYKQAVDDCSKVIEVEANDYRPWSTRGEALFNLGRIQDALKDINRSITLNPESGELRRLRGDLLTAAGDYPGAIGEYDIALGRKPADPTAHNNRGVVHALLGRNREAMEDFKKALETAVAPSSDVPVQGFGGTAW
ncbi:MAG: tetratricopeptide repeat protein [Pseudomonadota bacterium]